MCNFITGVLPRAADTAQFRIVVERFHLFFGPTHNACIAPQLKPDEGYFHVTRAHCDCGTALGKALGPQSYEREIRQFVAKGWSQTKIDRWLQTRGPRTDRHQAQGQLTVDQWCDFLNAALALPHCTYLGLLQHFYRHSTDDEAFTILDRVSMTVEDLRNGSVPWRGDVLYEIRLN